MMNGYGLFSGVVGIGMIIALSGTLVVADAKDKGGVLKASELIGMKVQGSDGKNVGKIRDLVIGLRKNVHHLRGVGEVVAQEGLFVWEAHICNGLCFITSRKWVKPHH